MDLSSLLGIFKEEIIFIFLRANAIKRGAIQVARNKIEIVKSATVLSESVE